MTLVLIKAKAWDLTTSSEVTFYWSQGRYMTHATDTPALTQFMDVIEEAPNYERFIFGPGRTSGRSVSGAGGFNLGNNKAKLDHWKARYRFNGRDLEVYRAANRDVPFAAASLWLTGKLNEPTYTDIGVEFTIQPRERDFDTQLCRTIGGTNVGGAGVDGLQEQQGQALPRAFGPTREISGRVVNPDRRIWCVNDGPFQTLEEAADSGLATYNVSAAVDHANSSALEAVFGTLSSTAVATCKAEGLVMLGSDPEGEVTFRIQGDSFGGAYVSKVGDIVQRIVVDYGPWSAGNLASGTIAQINSAVPASVQLYVDDANTTLAQALDDLLIPLGIGRVHSRLGKMRLILLDAPTGNPVGTIRGGRDTFDVVELTNSNDPNVGLPPYKIRIGYMRRHTILTGQQFAGSVPQSERVLRSEEYQYVEATRASVLTANPDSQQITFDTPYVSASAASTEALRRADLLSLEAGRDFVTWGMKIEKAASYDIGDEVRITQTRFGFSGGFDVIVTGLREDLQDDTSEFEAWG